MKRSIGIYIVMLWFLTGSVKGNQDLLFDTIPIPGVEITNSIPRNKIALISSGLDSISMEILSSRTLSQLLATQPAIFIKSAGRGSLSTASFRGTDASHTKVYWNGIKMNSPMLGQVDFSQLPVWIIDDLSLLYGGSSMQEGSGALGGAIMMENAVDWKRPLSISLNQEIGSFSTYGSYGKLDLGDEMIRSVTRIYSTSSRNNYPFRNTEIIPQEEQILANGAFKKGGLLQEIYMRPGLKHELALRLWYQESERELPALMSQEGADRNEMQEDRNLRTSLEWKMYPAFGTIKIRSGYAGSDMKYHLQHNDLNYVQFNTESLENSLYNTIQTEIWGGSRSRFEFRADYNRHDAGIRDLVQNEGYQHLRNEASLLASVQRQTGERWILYALVRQEWAEGNWLPVMPSAGYRYRIFQSESKKPGNYFSRSESPILSQSLHLKGSLSRNYNLPSLNDLYWIPGGNPDLRPESSINADLSLIYSRKNDWMVFQGIINGFAARVEDWILWKPTQFRYWQPENIATVFSRGMDIQLISDIYLGKWLITFRESYAYTRSTRENDSRQLIYIPVHSANANWNFSTRGYYLNWTSNYTGSRNTQSGTSSHNFATELKAYSIHDVHLGKSWPLWKGQAGLRFSIYNLFNTSYQAIRSRPMPMRNYALTLRLEI